VKYKLYYHQTSCIGCETCERVCGFLYERPRVHLYRVFGGIPVPIGCRHCEKAPCIKACPEGALFKDDDGFVLVDPEKCIGCLMCAVVCPFGAMDLDPITKSIFKCTACNELRARGLNPGCASLCPAEAIIFESTVNIFENIRKRVAEKLASSSLNL